MITIFLFSFLLFVHSPRLSPHHLLAYNLWRFRTIRIPLLYLWYRTCVFLRLTMQRYVKHLPFSKFFLHFFQKKISQPLALAGAFNLSPHHRMCLAAHSHIHTFTHLCDLKKCSLYYNIIYYI